MNNKLGISGTGLCLLTLAGLLCAGGLHAAPLDPTLTRAKRDVQAAYRAEDTGYAERDINVAFSYHANNYYSMDSKGRRLNYDQTHESLTGLFFAVQSCQAQTTLQKIALTADGVSVHLHKRLRMTLAPAPGQPKRLVVLDQQRTDLWTRNETGWRLKQSLIESQRKTVNGKQAGSP